MDPTTVESRVVQLILDGKLDALVDQVDGTVRLGTCVRRVGVGVGAVCVSVLLELLTLHLVPITAGHHMLIAWPQS